jgi:Flp pilus assembly protein TadD
MDPENVESMLERANRLLEAGKPAEALRCLETIEDDVSEPEDRVECATLKAWALSELGQTEEALDTIEPLLEEFPASARLHGTLGVVLSNAEELEDARRALETAIALDAEDEVSLANLALVYEKLHEYEKAIRLYDRAIEMGADIDWALQRRAAAQGECGDYAGAKVSLKRYLSLAPEDVSQWVSLAILHSDDEEYEQAFACYAEAERVDPKSPSLRLNWGVTAVRAGNLHTAGEQLQHLERLEPDSTRPLLLRAFILEEQGDMRAAQRCYEDCLARVTAEDRGELTYCLEMAMDFYARRNAKSRCERLLKRAYKDNACTVELCEAFRELVNKPLSKATWFSIMLEADYRPGLSEVYERGVNRRGPFTRFLRNFQVIARDRDEAMSLLSDFSRQMGEKNVRIREFVRDEAMEDASVGIYEVDRECLVFNPTAPNS